MKLLNILLRFTGERFAAMFRFKNIYYEVKFKAGDSDVLRFPAIWNTFHSPWIATRTSGKRLHINHDVV